MPIADLLAGRLGTYGRLPDRIEDLRGPARGVVMLPMHLSWPGLRECDVSDEASRRGMYGMLLSQGKRNDIVRFINADLLAADWALIADSLEPKLRRLCERVFSLGEVPPSEGELAVAEAVPAPDSRADGPAEITQDGAIA